MSDDRPQEGLTASLDWKRWLVRAFRNFILRFIFIGGALQTANYVFGGDDDYKAWIARERGTLVIGLVLCLIVNLMYEWLWRRAK